jgi:hypothetical protein
MWQATLRGCRKIIAWDANALYVAGDGWVGCVRRDNGMIAWKTPLAGNVAFAGLFESRLFCLLGAHRERQSPTRFVLYGVVFGVATIGEPDGSSPVGAFRDGRFVFAMAGAIHTVGRGGDVQHVALEEPVQDVFVNNRGDFGATTKAGMLAALDPSGSLRPIRASSGKFFDIDGGHWGLCSNDAEVTVLNGWDECARFFVGSKGLTCRVLAASREGIVVGEWNHLALFALDGRLIWRTEASPSVVRTAFLDACLLAHDGVTLEVFRLSDGRSLWVERCSGFAGAFSSTSIADTLGDTLRVRDLTEVGRQARPSLMALVGRIEEIPPRALEAVAVEFAQHTLDGASVGTGHETLAALIAALRTCIVHGADRRPLERARKRASKVRGREPIEGNSGPSAEDRVWRILRLTDADPEVIWREVRDCVHGDFDAATSLVLLAKGFDTAGTSLPAAIERLLLDLVHGGHILGDWGDVLQTVKAPRVAEAVRQALTRYDAAVEHVVEDNLQETDRVLEAFVSDAVATGHVVVEPAKVGLVVRALATIVAECNEPENVIGEVVEALVTLDAVDEVFVPDEALAHLLRQRLRGR